MVKKCSSEDIEVLSGLELIRRRPAMYLGGSLDNPKIQSELIKQSLCHAIDEYIEGNCSEIDINIFSDYIVIQYDAAMSLKVHPELKTCAAEIIMTRMHACHNFKKNIEVGGKFCRIGIAVVNAVSSKFILEILEAGKYGRQIYKNGEPIQEFEFSEQSGKDYTKFTIYPNRDLFKNLSFDRQDLEIWKDEILKELGELKIRVNFNEV